MTVYGALEAGGTKFVCLVGTGPSDVTASARFPTTTPAETLGQVVRFFSDNGPVAAAGVASFGPVELRRDQPRYGHITATPKPGWQDVDMVGPLREALQVPVGFATDVAGAALGEGRWGAAAGLTDFVYLTVGTGVGAAAMVNGQLANGLVHAEMGHIVLDRQDGDDFPGACPYHGGCLEGMASGPAIAERWGAPADTLTGESLARAVAIEAGYVAQALRTIVYVLAPQRIVLGGGVTAMPGLIGAVREALPVELAGYPGLAEHDPATFVVPPALPDAGAHGALILAERALAEA